MSGVQRGEAHDRYRLKKAGLWRKIRANLVAGMLVLLPLYFTYAILVWLFLVIDGIFNRVATRALVSALKLPLSEDQVIYGIGIITLLAVVIITGWIARNYFGNRLLGWFNSWLDRIPIVSAVYKTLRQLSEAILSSKGQAFQKPLLIEYPRKGLYTIVFKTHTTESCVKDAVGEDCVTVFLPSTPNPTTGYILFVPVSQAQDIDLTTQEALKLIVSGGVVSPDKGLKPAATNRTTPETPTDTNNPDASAED
jgi:uncharacterized membrane protein